MSKRCKSNYTSKSYPFSREQSFQKAFPHRGAGGSLRHGVSYEEAEVLGKLRTSVIATSSGKSLNEPLGDVEGLSTRFILLETVIHSLGEKGDAERLHAALKEYVLTWVELQRGEAR